MTKSRTVRNDEGKRLFDALLHMAEAEQFDDAYLEKLVVYRELYPSSEKFDIFYAWYAAAHKSYTVALKSALAAERKRPLNFEVWKLLILCYEKLGQRDKAAVYEGLCAKFYAVPLELTMPRSELHTYLARLNRGMCLGGYAPFHPERLIWSEQGLKKQGGVYAGTFIPGFYDEAGEGWWTGVYTGLEPMNNKGWLLSQHLDDDEYVRRCGAEVIFDIMKSELIEGEFSVSGTENDPVILPVAATEEQQEISFSTADVQNKAWLGKWKYSFFRVNEPVRISSPQAFVVGKSIRLGHRPHRKKLVLNILVDALCRPEMERREYRDIPNIMQFFSKGVVFQNHFSVAEYTYPSIPTIETGMYPFHSQLFNLSAGCSLRPEYKTMGEQLDEKGYYCTCPMADGSGIYNSVMRGYQRLIVAGYDQSAYAAAEHVIAQLDAFEECDQAMFVHIIDAHPWNARQFSVDVSAETHLPLHDRLAGAESDRASVYLPHTPLYTEGNRAGIRKADRSLGVIFDYLEAHYDEDEYIVQLFSDHGVPIYDEQPDILSENQTGAALMVRGAGVPAAGFVDELTSAVDIYPIMAKLAGFEVPAYVDGNLPAVFGGKGREYAISTSMYPGQTYKLCIRTKAYEFRLESLEPLDEDGTVDLTGASTYIVKRDGQRTPVEDTELMRYFSKIARKYTKSFDDEGHHWPLMREARPLWFNKEKQE